jgi:hypothetical protein
VTKRAVSNYRPTDTQIAVLKVIEQDLARAKAGFGFTTGC